MRRPTTAGVVRVHASQTSAQNWKWVLCQLHSRTLINAKHCLGQEPLSRQKYSSNH